MADREIITRRNLPHWYMPGAAHFLTYRLAGTIPLSVIQEMRERREQKLNAIPRIGNPRNRSSHRERVHKQFFAEYDKYLDFNQHGIDWLQQPRVASLVRANLYHHHGSRYRLLSYCVMPNHVHVVLMPHQPKQESQETIAIPGDETSDRLGPLAQISHGLKSYTAKRINHVLGRTGQFWQHESYDHWVRDDDELERIVYYIRSNPVAANLVRQPQDWLYSSCSDRFQFDADPTGWLSDEAAAHWRGLLCS